MTEIGGRLFTQAYAEATVERLNRDEEEAAAKGEPQTWTYKLVPVGDLFKIAIHDETDEFVGYL